MKASGRPYITVAVSYQSGHCYRLGYLLDLLPHLTPRPHRDKMQEKKTVVSKARTNKELVDAVDSHIRHQT